MKRTLYAELLKWKDSPNRKPLILHGARQVGKTYLVSEFAENEYSDFIYLNFEENPELIELFSGSLNVDNIIQNISLYFGRKIVSENTLIFFDEIQNAPSALTSLKYFYEQASEFNIIAAGSLLGVSIGKPTSFPVGKVNFLRLYPMNFYEFLIALGEELLAEMLVSITEPSTLQDVIHNKFLKYFKLYLYIGGMPEAVSSYAVEKDIAKVREVQMELLDSYERDFSKYADKKQAIKTKEVWSSIPYQLAKEKKKFKYSNVKAKARAAQYEQTIEWLKGAGVINVCYNISVPKLPLPGYADRTKFKIYLFDTGLLGAMLDLTSAMIIEPEAIFKDYNGAFIENFVAQELIAGGERELFYWTSKSDAEIDFIIENEGKVYPLEVKSGTNLNLKSLKSYSDKFKPELKFRASPRNFIRSGDFVNVPLYAVSLIKGLV
jgi:predicted AAA+ superfamily ATPase